LITVIVAAKPACLADQRDAGDPNRYVEGFAHVVVREGCGCHSDQRFRLHACLGGRCHTGAKFHPIFA
jgi:hypothetical protein